MSVVKKNNALNAPEKRYDEKLYIGLSAMDLTQGGYSIDKLGEDMSVVEQSIWGRRKQRYLIDNKNGRAYEIINGDMNFVNFTTDDVNWESLAKLPEKAKVRAQWMSAQFPTLIHEFRNGVAEVSWQLNPDYSFYVDDDGLGVTSDEEITVYGFIDSQMNVLVKFQYIDKDWNRLDKMRQEAETILKTRKK